MKNPLVLEDSLQFFRGQKSPGGHHVGIWHRWMVEQQLLLMPPILMVERAQIIRESALVGLTQSGGAAEKKTG